MSVAPARQALQIVALALGVVLLGACSGASRTPTPTLVPFVTPSPRPTAQATIAEALDGALFTIHLGDELIAVEEFAVQDTEAGLVLYSELRAHPGLELLQRRTLLLSGADLPLRYELEERSGNARSLWVAERADGALTVLNDDLDAPLPVVLEGIAPTPSVLIEGRPSALPYALLAWQQTAPSSTAGDEDAAARELAQLDVTAALPAAQALTVGPAGASTGEMIGADGYHASAPTALNPELDFWVRATGRSLMRVRVPDYHWGLSAQLAMPGMPDGETLVIQRVTALPTLAADEAGGETLTFTDAQGQERQARLQLPAGAGPHPVAILLGPEGLRPAWEGADALPAAGWATCSYLPRGLANGEADYERAAFTDWASDAVAVAQALAARSDIVATRIVLLGWREGAIVAAQALADDTAPLAAAVLLDPPGAGPLFPDQLAWRNAQLLAPAYGWTAEQAAHYDTLTLDRGRDWLFEGTEELTTLGRRLDIGYLRVYADTDLAALLAASRQPVLLLADPAGRWAAADATANLATALAAQGRGAITSDIAVPALIVPQTEALDDAAATAIATWLAALP